MSAGSVLVTTSLCGVQDEDVAALDVLGAVPRWLDFADHQYLDVYLPIT